jgi:uncharacterized membrane protein
LAASDAGVSLREAHKIQGNIFVIVVASFKFFVPIAWGVGVARAFQLSVILFYR